MNRVTHGCRQGSDEWLDLRAKFFTASELSAAAGESKYQTRDALLKQKATGQSEEINDGKQRLFDAGHAAEAAARPLVEGRIGAELFPVTMSCEVDGMPLLASLDGIDMMGEIVWESKLLNSSLKADIERGELGLHYAYQIEQQLLVSGAEKCYFTASDGTAEGTFGMWYESSPDLRAKIVPIWKQFATDLAAYQYVEVLPAAVAAPTMDLPAVSVQVSGSIALISNLDVFGTELKKFIARIDLAPNDDQGFANAEAAIKTLEKAQAALEAAESGALAQTASIDEMRRTVALYVEQARTTRLLLEKMVKARKETIKVEIRQGGVEKLSAHVAALNKRIGRNLMPIFTADWAGVMKSKRTLESLRGAVDDELARCKIATSAIADQIEINIKSLVGDGFDWTFLFPDLQAVCAKSSDDFASIVFVRSTQHNAAEQKKLDAQREKIRAEEVAKLAREQAAEAKTKADAEALEKRLAESQVREDARQAEMAGAVLTVRASHGIDPSPVGNVKPMIEDIIPHANAGQSFDGEAFRLQTEIREQTSAMGVDDLKLVLHYIGRIQAQRVAA